MHEREYFQLPTKPPVDVLRSPDRDTLLSSPSWSERKDLEKNRSFVRKDLPNNRDPKTPGSPAPMLTSNFSDIRISSDAQSGSPKSLSGKNVPKPTSKHNPHAMRQTRHSDSTAPTGCSVEQVTGLDLLELFNSFPKNKVLSLDIRSLAQYQLSRLAGAINIAMPPILLKRPVHTIEKIAEVLDSTDKVRLLNWAEMCLVVIYDNDSYNVGPGSVLHQFATKFLGEDCSTQITVVRGGYKAISREAEHLTDRSTTQSPNDTSQEKATSEAGSMKGLASIKALGSLRHELPARDQPINPFFNNIRQNQDLIGGVGDPIPLKVPSFRPEHRARLPEWLRRVAFEVDGAKFVAEKFLKIEQEEQQRMQQVLRAGAGLACDDAIQRHSVAAGVERGDKNRYNNIWPYENARVRLHQDMDGTNEYINASRLHVEDSDRYYIATQGPLPGTTKDFWQMIWENEIRMIVMLTRVVEGGQAKCHTYWDDADMMAPFTLEILEVSEIKAAYHQEVGIPLIIRRFRISDKSKPLASPREVTHVQFLEWPDLHVVKPEAILALVREVRDAEHLGEQHIVKRRKSVGSHTSAPRSRAPILSHCSAGCGRTGVFCTVDTVIELTKHQLHNTAAKPQEFDIDLVEKTVRVFRDQRLSMVQTLRQYVLCYEAILSFCADYLG